MVINYKCPSCGSFMEFDSSTQKMVCEHCGTTRTVREMDEADPSRKQDERDEQKQDFKTYSCPSCGAQILTDENTVATFCSFCGSPSLMEDRLTGEKSPAVVIPFKMNKERAMEIYRKWAGKGLLTPSGFLNMSTIEKFTGIYVPFWLYDYQAKAKVVAKCTRVRTTRAGDTEYIHTDHFDVIRDIDSEYVKVPADASEQMPDDVMDRMEPFNYQELTEFEMPYLSGYLAEKYNYTSDELSGRIEERVSQFIDRAVMDTIQGYVTVNVIDKNILLNCENAKYALFPVWLLKYRYRNKDYTFTINGQTGKFDGKLPISIGRLVACISITTSVLFLIFMLLGGIFG